MSTREKLKKVRRAVVPCELPGGDTVPVRHLTIAELRRIDARAEGQPDDGRRDVFSTVLLAASALAEDDGGAAFPGTAEAPGPTAEDLALVEETFGTDQLAAICRAAVSTKADAKNS